MHASCARVYDYVVCSCVPRLSCVRPSAPFREVPSLAGAEAFSPDAVQGASAVFSLRRDTRRPGPRAVSGHSRRTQCRAPQTAIAMMITSPSVETMRGASLLSRTPALTTARFPPRTRPRTRFKSRVWTYPRSPRSSRCRREGYSVGCSGAATETQQGTARPWTCRWCGTRRPRATPTTTRGAACRRRVYRGERVERRRRTRRTPPPRTPFSPPRPPRRLLASDAPVPRRPTSRTSVARVSRRCFGEARPSETRRRRSDATALLPRSLEGTSSGCPSVQRWSRTRAPRPSRS